MQASRWIAQRRKLNDLDRQYLLAMAKMLNARAEQRSYDIDPLKERFQLGAYRFYTAYGRGWVKPAGNVRNRRYPAFKLTKEGLRMIALTKLQGGSK